MSDKKKLSAAKTDGPMNNPSSIRNPKEPLATRLPAGKQGVRASAPRDDAGAAPERSRPEKQLADFEAASKLFHSRKFREARELFLAAAAGPERDVAHRAGLHAAMCNQRLEQREVRCQTAEDHYNYGVALLNTRQSREAASHLERGLQMAPDSDHIHYALAVAHSLLGDWHRAHEHLRRSIELDPKNRLMARQDPDLGSVVSQPQFQALLYPEKKSW
jgi:tetratricopeptide (TPR) repeat protein